MTNATSPPTAIEATGNEQRRPGSVEIVVAPRSIATLVMLSFGGLLLLAVAYMARAILVELSAAIVLAMALEPAVQAFQRRGMVRGHAVTVTYAGAAIISGAFLFIMMPPLVDGVAGLVRQLPDLVGQLVQKYPQMAFLGQPFDVIETLRALLMDQSEVSPIGRSAFNLVRQVLQSQSATASIVFLSFFVAIDGRRWWEGILGLMPDASRRRWRRIGSGVAEVVGGYVFGNLLISVVAGTVAAFVLLVMRVPYAVPLGVIVAFLDLIPLVGALLGTIIAGAFALTQGAVTAAIVVAALVLYQQFENNTLTQLVYNRTVKISALAVAVSVLAGAELAGIPGALLAIPVAGSFKVITHELLARRKTPVPGFGVTKGAVVVLFIATAALWCVSPPARAQAAADPRRFASDVLHFGDDDLSAIDRGEVVTRPLAATDRTEIAAFGVVRAVGTPDLLIQVSKDINRFRHASHIRQIGPFSSPPRPEDLDLLQVPSEDLKALRNCRPGSCDVKLGPRAMEELARIDWTAQAPDSEGVALIKRMLLEFVVTYQKGGVNALEAIADKSTTKSRTEEYQELLAHSPYLVEYVREFQDYVAVYPERTLPQTEDLFYWAKEEFGLKPVISLHHLTLHREGDHILMANKLLAASHYFNASLEILAGVPAPDGNGMYLLSLLRARIDPPTGKLAGVQMGKVRSGLEAGVRRSLESMRARLAEAAAQK